MLFIAEKNRNKENTLAPSLNRLVSMLWDETYTYKVEAGRAWFGDSWNINRIDI